MAEPRPERKIIIIPAKKESPQEQAKKRNLRVAAYCRVSTGDEEQLTSYENQKAFYTEKIMKNPDWTMVNIFADEGITGTSTCRRKQFLRMIRQCRQGKIDMILAKSVSRFARNTLDTISYTRELRSLGTAVIFEEQNINSIYPESEFLIALHAAFAQSESESISANVRWGKRQSIKDGKVTFQYKTMLGYEKGPDGAPVVIPEEAEIICRIFEWYLAGRSIQNIRQALEASGVRNAAGTTEWTTSNLRSILTNEKYCGDALLQKTFIKDCISKKAILNTGQLPKVLIQDNHEAIVSREMFDAVQLEIARRRAQAHKKKRPYRTRQIQRQVCTQRTAVLRGMRHSLPTRRMDTARRKARGMALHEPPGLWKEILPAFSDARRGASPTGHTERRQFCHVRSRHSDRTTYRCDGAGACPYPRREHESRRY